MHTYIKFFKDIVLADIPEVGGKNASLGEMVHYLAPQGVNLPNGFATTAKAYYYFLESAGIKDEIAQILSTINTNDVTDAEPKAARIRQLIIDAKFPEDFEAEIRQGYQELCKICGQENLIVAIRSSATAEDLPNASFAGQQESFLNISGEEDVILSAKKCIASLFTDRAITYRVNNGFDHTKIALSVGVQQMVAVHAHAAGVMFTIDTESGFKNAVVVSAVYGLGENIVLGHANPDEFTVFKPTMAIIRRKLGSKKVKMIPVANDKTENLEVPLEDQRKYAITDEQVKTLATWAVAIHEHYGKPMDIEWALDEVDGKMYIVQARAETVQSRKNPNEIEAYVLTGNGLLLTKGTRVGNKIGAGKATRIMNLTEIGKFNDGDVLVTEMTDPDWVEIMRRASAVVTDKGGRTCHAAIVSRELGIPCVVGTADATAKIPDGADVTVTCAGGNEGLVYGGILKYEVHKTDIQNLPKTKTKIMMNVGSPDLAFEYSQIPNDGVGLAREEFIIDSHIKIHPMALLKFDELQDQEAKKTIEDLTMGYTDKAQYYVDKLAEGIATIGAAFHPRDVIIRFSDFKTNEYANLIGGKQFEPNENNPMIGWRGASRYYDPKFQAAFELECRAFLKCRNEMGLTNIKAMIPFCRTLDEARKCLDVMAGQGLKRGENGFEVYVMCEIPANVILASQFADLFDGFSIGSNDLTQLALGVDRDNSAVAHVYSESNEAVKELIRTVVKVAHEKHVKIGLCGQAPSDNPEFAAFLVEIGIDSMSLAPDSVIQTTIQTKEIEDRLGR